MTKTPLPDSKFSHRTDTMFNLKDHARHTLFCGTQIIQTRYYGNQKVKAVVIRTGTGYSINIDISNADISKYALKANNIVFDTFPIII